jgi:hypothetical protein
VAEFADSLGLPITVSSSQCHPGALRRGEQRADCFFLGMAQVGLAAALVLIQRLASVRIFPKPNSRSSAVTRVKRSRPAVAAKKRSAGSW